MNSHKITMTILLTPVIGALYLSVWSLFDKSFRDASFDIEMVFWGMYQGITVGALLTFLLL